MAWNPNVPTITNRVQDDLDAIRENFQHFDQLAERVDELQTVSDLAPIANDLQTVSGLAPVVEELQTVSGLAPVANELQTVSGLAQIANDLQTVSELAPYVQAILDSRIVEMGSNSNGEYVRWENGLQVCWHKITGLTTTNIQGNIYGSLSQSWTYPAAFTSAPSVLAAAERTSASGTGIGWGTFASVPGATSTSSLILASSHSTFEGNLVLFAIGRWK